MHSLPGFIIFFHEVSFFLPTNIGISSEPPHFACLFSFIAKNLNIEIVFVSLHRLTNNLFIFITIWHYDCPAQIAGRPCKTLEKRPVNRKDRPAPRRTESPKIEADGTLLHT